MKGFVGVSILVLMLGLAGSTLAAETADKCGSHTDCGDLEVCVEATCELAIGRTYLVTIGEAKISEKRTTGPKKGKAWDAVGGLPDPQVVVYFPDINTRAFTAPKKKDTTEPAWNQAGKVTVTASGQEIWFCFFDVDAAETDAINTSAKGNCTGYKNVLDFIRSGTFKIEDRADVKSFNASIRRK